MGLHIDLSEQFQFCEGTRPAKGNLIHQVHDTAHGSQAVLEGEDFRGAQLQRESDELSHFHNEIGRAQGSKIRDQMDVIRKSFMELCQHGALPACKNRLR